MIFFKQNFQAVNTLPNMASIINVTTTTAQHTFWHTENYSLLKTLKIPAHLKETQNTCTPGNVMARYINARQVVIHLFQFNSFSYSHFCCCFAKMKQTAMHGIGWEMAAQREGRAMCRQAAPSGRLGGWSTTDGTERVSAAYQGITSWQGAPPRVNTQRPLVLPRST